MQVVSQDDAPAVTAFNNGSTSVLNAEVFLVEVTNAANGAFTVLGESSALPFGSQVGQFSLTVILSGQKPYTFDQANGIPDYLCAISTNMTTATNYYDLVV